jgi:hypothetical protein
VLRLHYLLLLMVMIVEFFTPVVNTESFSGFECSVFYFFNGIVVYESGVNDTLVLETPQNISLIGGFNQTVTPILAYNLDFNSSTNYYYFNVSEGSSYTGFFIVRVEVCGRSMEDALNTLRSGLIDPGINPFGNNSIPEEIKRDYIGQGNRKVEEVVIPAYEDWLRSHYGLSTSDLSTLGLVSTSAYFVYGVYFTYDPSAIPRSIDEVVDSRRGDCDDLTRVLASMLYHYNIPAVQASGYLYVKGLNITIPIEKAKYTFLNNGPHAFLYAYIPGYGWLSTDFLAGSMLVYPFIFESYTTIIEVPREEVEEFLELHRKLNATQVFAVFNEEEYKSLFSGEELLEKALSFLYSKAGYITTKTTTTPIETRTTQPVETPTTNTPPEYTTNTPTLTTGLPKFKFSTTLMVALGFIILLVILLLLMHWRYMSFKPQP